MLAISRCFSRDIEAKPRRSLRGPDPLGLSITSSMLVTLVRSPRPSGRRTEPWWVPPEDPGRGWVSVRQAAFQVLRRGPSRAAFRGLVASFSWRDPDFPRIATCSLLRPAAYQRLCQQLQGYSEQFQGVIGWNFHSVLPERHIGRAILERFFTPETTHETGGSLSGSGFGRSVARSLGGSVTRTVVGSGFSRTS